MDQSGASVPGVSITVKNLETGIVRTTATGPTGRYQVPDLPVGRYEASASLAGFQTSIRTGIELTVGRTAVVDHTLLVGEVNQAITVTGEVALIETTNATVSALVQEKQVQDLPLNNRDLTELAYLQPGVIKMPTTGTTAYTGMGEKITVAGSRGNQNDYLLDGVSNSDLSGNPQGASGSYIGAETVKEFQIITNNYSAEYRSQAGAIISAVTKSGTNSFHGSLFEFLRNDNLDAAKWEDNRLGNKKPEFKRNQFGGSFGGPVIKDRTFFFGSYEGLRERQGSTGTALVPTPEARLGNLPGRTPIAVDPKVKPYLALYPIPGQGNSINQDLGDGTVRIVGTTRSPAKDDYVVLRVDHHFSGGRAGSLSGTYNREAGNNSSFGLLGELNGAANTSRKHVVAVNHTSILSPTTLNEFKFGYSFTVPQDAVPVNPRDFTGLTFLPGRKLMGDLSVSTLSGIGFRVDAGQYEQKTVTFKEGLSLTRGNHSMRVGIELDRRRYVESTCSAGCNGTYSFTSLINFLQNKPREFDSVLPGHENVPRRLRQIFFGSYFQDNWTVRPSLTLNLGLRHEFVTVPKEDDGLISNLVNFFDSAVSITKKAAPRYPDQKFAGYIDTLFNNATLKSFSPRFGFAWAPGLKKLSVRGGFGIFYEHPMLYNLQTGLREVPPFGIVGRAQDSDATRAGTTLLFPDAIPTQTALLLATPNMWTMNYHQDTAYIYRWSLTLQRGLGSKWMVSAGYTGSRALHLLQQVLPNVNKWLGWPNQPSGQKRWPDPSSSQFLGPINPSWGVMRLQYSNANSFHHDLAVGVQKGLSHGLTLQMSYTLSKTIDDGSGVTSGGDNLPQGQRGVFAWDMNLKRGLSSFDIRHSLVTNFSYVVPFGRDSNGIAGALGKGWQLNGILSLATGYPLSIGDSRNIQSVWIGSNEGLRASLIPGGNNNPVLGGPEKYFDVSQFSAPEPGTFGNLGRNTLISPGLATFDGSLFRSLSVREKQQIQVRLELFNLLNRPNFGSPNTNLWQSDGSPNPLAATITSTRTSARQIQFGLKYVF